MTIMASCSILSAVATTPQELVIYINPGHGGYDSDDRNVVIDPYKQGDPEGYWESKSNLVKGMHLRDLLNERGYTTGISRVTNTTADDLGLETIGGLANAAGADIFLSIHSNATGTANRRNAPLMLFRGYDTEAVYPESPKVATIMNEQLLKNEATVWTSTSINIRGDWSFYSWGTQGLGVLRKLQMTGVLSEGSFHDYVPEAYRLMNSDFCWMEAWHFLKSYEQYYGIESKETKGYVAGVVYDSRLKRDVDYKMYDRDEYIPINGAKVELCKEDGTKLQEYVTDNINNGFYLLKDVEPGTYKLKITKDTHISAETSVVVTANNISYSNIALQKIRDTAPEVVSYTPMWTAGEEGLLCNTPIVFNFNWDMDATSTEAAFKITPAVEGTLTWSDANYKMTFTPTTPYLPNTEYTVTLGKSAQHAGGMSMVADKTFTFKSDNRDYLTILNYFPRAGAEVNVKSPVVAFLADQYLDAPTAYNNIKIKDASGNELAYSSRSITYGKYTEPYGWAKMPLSKALVAGEDYTITIPVTVADKTGIHVKDEIVEHFKAVDMSVAKTDAVNVNEFDDVTTLVGNSDQSKASTLTITKDSSSKLFGTACASMKYTFTEQEGGKIVIDVAPTTETVSGIDAIEMSIFGDISSNTMNLIFVSDAEEVIVPMGAIDYLGWQTKRVNLGLYLKADKNYTLKGIEVNQDNAKQGAAGIIKIDNLVKFVSQGSVENIETSTIRIYPNPASEYIIVNGESYIEGLQLFDLNGKLIAKQSGNVINVSEIVSGTYIIKVYVSGSEITQKVVVKHD